MFRCVMSLHGIRTRGVWQKELVPVLARQALIPYALDYGNFSLVEFASSRARSRKVDWLRGQYERVIAEAGVRRPSIVAHSFGTYLVAGLLTKYPELIFDKVIFAGSIVKRDFNWPPFLAAGRVNLVRNDYGALDPWPRRVRWLVRDSGASGTLGFTATNAALLQQEFAQHHHSDYFHREHFLKYWVPTLLRVVVNPVERPRFTDILDIACQAVANRLTLAPALVRANIFVPDERGQLRIPEGLVHNMTDPIEQTVTITPGTGCTGIAFQERKQAVAMLKHDWGTHTLPENELAKVNKRLRWIVSTPIPDPDVAGGVLGIFNVDGLDASKERGDLEPIFQDLVVWAQALAVTFKELA